MELLSTWSGYWRRLQDRQDCRGGVGAPLWPRRWPPRSMSSQRMSRCPTTDQASTRGAAKVLAPAQAAASF